MVLVNDEDVAVRVADELVDGLDVDPAFLEPAPFGVIHALTPGGILRLDDCQVDRGCEGRKRIGTGGIHGRTGLRVRVAVGVGIRVGPMGAAGVVPVSRRVRRVHAEGAEHPHAHTRRVGLNAKGDAHAVVRCGVTWDHVHRHVDAVVAGCRTVTGDVRGGSRVSVLGLGPRVVLGGRLAHRHHEGAVAEERRPEHRCRHPRLIGCQLGRVGCDVIRHRLVEDVPDARLGGDLVSLGEQLDKLHLPQNGRFRVAVVLDLQDAVVKGCKRVPFAIVNLRTVVLIEMRGVARIVRVPGNHVNLGLVLGGGKANDSDRPAFREHERFAQRPVAVVAPHSVVKAVDLAGA